MRCVADEADRERLQEDHPREGAGARAHRLEQNPGQEMFNIIARVGHKADRMLLPML